MALCKGNQYSKHRYASATLACLHICASGGHFVPDEVLFVSGWLSIHLMSIYFVRKPYNLIEIL